MRKGFYLTALILLSGSLAAQTNNTRNRNGSKTVFEGRPGSIRLALHLTATVRLPEPVNSVVVGDANLFQAEYSPNEPLLVFVTAKASSIAQTNLVISTVRGRQFILLLRAVAASGDEPESAVDLLVICQASGLHFIEETFPSALISETVGLAGMSRPPPTRPVGDTGFSLDEILNRHRQQAIETAYGDRVRVGIGEVVEDGSSLIVPFSVMNPKPESIELLSPQIQLAGQNKAGVFQRSRWTTVQQVPIRAYQMSQRRLNPGARADGVVVFERPATKQSTEGLFLQIADSAAIDQPTLAPINFRETNLMENRQ